ncbi:MAG: GspH/FimT family pseudopilin [Anaerolineae bacterium]
MRDDHSPNTTAPSRHTRACSPKGFSVPELLVVIGIIAILALIALPWLLPYLQATTVKSSAEELQSGLNRAKSLAVTTRQNICVQVVGNQYRFLQGGCAGPAWVGAGTDATGAFTLPSGVTITNGGTNPIFTQFGTASPTGILTVSGSSGTSLTVTVLPSGAITIP